MGNKLKRKDIAPCGICGEKLMAKNFIHAYRVKVEQFVFDTAAIQSTAGHEMMIGNVAMATAMGPDLDLAHGLGEKDVLICVTCYIGRHIHDLEEAGEEE